ncbi:hypothetical protein [Lacibacter luteus]|nr:hypothetical protein [Lacibacter luteus]
MGKKFAAKASPLLINNIKYGMGEGKRKLKTQVYVQLSKSMLKDRKFEMQ